MGSDFGVETAATLATIPTVSGLARSDKVMTVAGDRRTVVGREGPVFAGLEFGGFFGVPHRVSKKISQLWLSVESNRELRRLLPPTLNGT